jgi:hypothetical protein
MWIVRFLNGPLAGQIVPLTKHQTLLGRAPNCDIKIPSANVSKEHTRIEVFDDKLIISDAGSRNGTFINGVQVRSSKAKTGDKIAIHDVFFEVQQVPDNWAAQYRQPYPQYGAPPAHQHQQYGAAAYQMQPGAHASPQMQHDMPPEARASAAGDLIQTKIPHWAELMQEYVERVVLPGIFQLPEMFDFKWVLAGMMALFILLVTSLSMIPLSMILRDQLEAESQQHALTIAMTLARVNIPALAQGLDSAVSVDIATSRESVSKAFVISNVDGNVIAPANQAGQYPDVPYVNEGRKLDHESVKQVTSGTIVAMYPVRAYNADTGQQAITAWAVVLFDMGALSVNSGEVIGLFFKTLFISLLLGFILFYFLYKIIEYPIRSINLQLDQALKDGLETVHVEYKFPAIQLLASNVSSALSRAVNGSQESGGGNKQLEHDRNREIGNLVELMGFAAMGIRAADLTIAAVNQAFEARIGVNSAQLATLTLNELSDQALKLSVKDLIERLDKNPDDLATNELEFSGLNFQIVAQAIYGTSKIAYYLIVLLPKSEGE